MDPIDHKETRYRILKALHFAHPYGLTERALHSTICSINVEVTESDIASEIVYLREKGYVGSDRKIDKALREKIWIHKVTPRGIDLLEGNIPEGDPGINLQPCR